MIVFGNRFLAALTPEVAMTARKVTVATLSALKARNEKAVFVTAYDYPTATFADRAGVDMMLVGDSAAMTMLGLPSTLQIGLDEMLVFIKAVTRAAKHAFVVGDFAVPFLPTLRCNGHSECRCLHSGRLRRGEV